MVRRLLSNFPLSPQAQTEARLPKEAGRFGLFFVTYRHGANEWPENSDDKLELVREIAGGWFPHHLELHT